jgi:hypothetical protein
MKFLILDDNSHMLKIVSAVLRGFGADQARGAPPRERGVELGWAAGRRGGAQGGAVDPRGGGRRGPGTDRGRDLA